MYALEHAANAALVAGDAGEDVLGPALGELVRHVGVGNEAAADHGVVANAVAQGGGGLLVVGEAAVGQHGDGDGLAHGLGAVQLQNGLLIEHRGHGELPLLITARVHVEGVHAVLLEVFGQLQALGQLAEAGVGHAVVGAELDEDGRVLARAPAHGRDLLEQEGGAALDVAAVFVGAGVPGGGQELVVQVAAVGVHLKGVRPGCGAEPGGALGLRDEALYLLNAQLVTLDVGRV